MVTLEDVIEKMINIEILDEDDYARNKSLLEKAGTKNKTRFYKDAIKRELARSFMEEKKEKLSMIIENSFKNAPTLLDKEHYLYEDQSLKLKEPLL